jgi:hypothetical protein
LQPQWYFGRGEGDIVEIGSSRGHRKLLGS